jgi:hypothetical protein
VIIGAFVVALIAIAVACGLDVTGGTGDATGGDAQPGSEASLPDARTNDDGGTPKVVFDADIGDAGVGVPFDAGLDDAQCDAATFDDPLTGIDSKWLLSANTNNPGHPTVILADFGGGKERNIVSMAIDHGGDARGGLWLTTPEAMRAFDVQFAAAVACQDGCGDGLAAVWLDTSGSGGTLKSIVDNASVSQGLGIPNGVPGIAFAVDIYQNGGLGDPPAPAIELLELSNKAAGTYPWVKQSQSNSSFGDSIVHTYTFRLRKGQLTLNVDGKSALSETVTTPATGAFGFTAATGGGTGTFYVWDFHAAFFACDP